MGYSPSRCNLVLRVLMPRTRVIRTIVLMLALIAMYLGVGLFVGYEQPTILFDNQMVLYVALTAAALRLWQLERRHGASRRPDPDRS